MQNYRITTFKRLSIALMAIASLACGWSTGVFASLETTQSNVVSAADTQAAPQTASQRVTEKRELLISRLEQLESDNNRLRQQLSQVQSTESVRSLQKVLEDHNQIIANLRETQIGAPAAGVSQSVVSTGPTQIEASDSISAANAFAAPIQQTPASIWSLEMAGASGVVALIGALVLLFVITVLRKSYWLPRKAEVQRPAAFVSEQGLEADIAKGYENRQVSSASAANASTSRVDASEERPAGEISETVSAQAQARLDQQAMDRMLEQGLCLSEEDQALMAQVPELNDKVEPTKAKPEVVRTVGLVKAPRLKAAAKRNNQQPKNPLSGEYDLLGSSGFDDVFSENGEFDELFEQAAYVPDGREVDPAKAKGANCPRRSDEEVLRSIREKTFAYAGPTIDDGTYIVEEGCDDLDKYMDIEFIEPPVVQMDEAKENRALNSRKPTNH